MLPADWSAQNSDHRSQKQAYMVFDIAPYAKLK
jgi:hypothetical protein